MLLLVSKHEPQTLSQYVDNFGEEYVEKNKPWYGVPLRYLKTLWTASKWEALGAWIKWLKGCTI